MALRASERITRSTRSALALAATVTFTCVPASAGAGQALDVEEFGRWTPEGGRGPANTVTVDGATAYFGEGRFLKVLDTSDPAKPTLRGSLGLSDSVREIVKIGDHAYLANASAGMTIVDVREETEPLVVGTWATPGYCWAIAVEGGRAYVIDDSALRILDVADPTRPFELGSWSIPGFARAVAVEGDLAFVPDYFFGLRIVDVSRPAAPFEVGSWSVGGALADVAAEGDLAFVADSLFGVRVLDVSDPASPFELAAVGAANSLAVEGNLLYLVGNGLRSIDVSDPAAPLEVGYWPFVAVDRVDVEGNLAYVVDRDRGLTVVDTSDPAYGGVMLQRAAPDGWKTETVVQAVRGGGGVALDVQGGRLYWGVDSCPAHSKIMMSALDGSEVKTVVDGLDNVWDVALDLANDKIYWTGGSGCRDLIDLNPAILRANLDGSAVEVVLNLGTHRAVGIAIDPQENEIYFSAQTDCVPCAAILRMDLDGSTVETILADLEFPEELAIDVSARRLYWTDSESILRADLDGSGATPIVEGIDGVGGIALTADHLYWTARDRIQRSRLDGSDAEDLLVANLPHDIAVDPSDGRMYWMTPGAVPPFTWHVPGSSRDVEVVGSLAYVADRDAGLRILDLTNPDEPFEVGSRDTPDEALDVEVVGSVAYVADDASGLRIIDVSNPADPVDVGSFDERGPRDVEVEGSLAYVANFYSGLQILDVSNPAAPFVVGGLDTFDFARAVDLAGNLAFVAANPMRIIDVSNPAAPFQVGSWPGSAVDVEVAGSLAYVIRSFGDLQIVNVSNPSAPFLVASWDIANVANSRVEVAGDLAYVGNEEAGLRVIDVSDPTVPREVGSLGTFAEVFSTAIVDGLIYFADGSDGLGVAKLTAIDHRIGRMGRTSCSSTTSSFLLDTDLEVMRRSGVYTPVPGSNSLALREWGPGAATFFLVTGVDAQGETDLRTDNSATVRPDTNSCP